MIEGGMNYLVRNAPTILPCGAWTTRLHFSWNNRYGQVFALKSIMGVSPKCGRGFLRVIAGFHQRLLLRSVVPCPLLKPVGGSTGSVCEKSHRPYYFGVAFCHSFPRWRLIEHLVDGCCTGFQMEDYRGVVQTEVTDI